MILFENGRLGATQTESIGEGLSTEKCENKEHSVTRSSNLESNFWLKSKVY